MDDIDLEKVVEKLATGDVPGAFKALISACVATLFTWILTAAFTGVCRRKPTARWLENEKRMDNESEKRRNEETNSLLRELKPSRQTDDELISALKGQQANICGELVLWGRLFSDESSRKMERVFVSLTMGRCEGSKVESRVDDMWGRRVTLEQLLVVGGTAQDAPRWVVLGDPGAGKSTLARHLVWEHAIADGESAVSLVLYATLPQLAERDIGPFELAERELCARDVGRGNGLAAALRRLTQSPRRVWLLLDSLDEVSEHHRQWVRDRLIDWANE